jgi:hypothetical protein
VSRCVFPPDALDAGVVKLHEMGYTGPLSDFLLLRTKRRDRRRLGANLPAKQ